MPDFLIFQLYGAMASWGDIAVGEHRPSLGHPTKSAINGLIAAAIGIDRTDEVVHQQLARHYGVAVCLRASGELMRDYHTVQVPSGKRDYATRRDELLTDKLNLNTILTQRDYRTDAFYQVALWCIGDEAPYTLETFKNALEQPKYCLYLGRKSCPVSLPLHPQVFSGVSLKQGFDEYPAENARPKSLLKYQGKFDEEPTYWTSAMAQYYWEEGGLDQTALGIKSDDVMIYPRRDKVSSRKRWQFSNRDEFYYAQVLQE